MPKRTTAASVAKRLVIVTLDAHLASATERAALELARCGGMTVSLHSAAHWANCQSQLDACEAAIAKADVVFVSMLFVDEHIRAIRPALEARRDGCDAMVCVLSAPEICALTRMGSLDMSKPQGGALSWLKKLRGSSKDGARAAQSAGARQMGMLKRLPQLLRFIPGTAQDLRIYFLAMRYWLFGSQRNLANLSALLLSRYSGGGRIGKVEEGKVPLPVEYPEIGVYHPSLPNRLGESVAELPAPDAASRGTIGLILMRSYVLAENTAHYDAVINALEARGLRVVPVFASGLDARPAIDALLRPPRGVQIDALLSLTGFSLIGGPAYNDSEAAAALLAELDVPYLSAHALEFQSLAQWQENDRGLLPLETMMMVAIPELDGATVTSVYGGRLEGESNDLVPEAGRVERLADRAAALINLRQQERAHRRVAIVLYDFPPNSGGVGTAASLSVFASLQRTLESLAAEGYDVEVPADVDSLRAAILNEGGDGAGLPARVLDRIGLDEYLAAEPHLEELEAVWGPAPGRSFSDGRSLLVLGARFGNVLVAVQPPFGYEGDPMRLMFAGGHAPTHAFSAFYRYLREQFAADAVVHFGTHGALEFMPGKQVGLSDACWPERLLGALPNFYLYAANNPSEGAIAKRRSAATTISYLTPAVTRAGLYQDLQALRSLLDQLRDPAASDPETREELLLLVKDQAATLELVGVDAQAWAQPERCLDQLREQLNEFESALIPDGLHVLGEPPTQERLLELLTVVDGSLAGKAPPLSGAEVQKLATGELPTGLAPEDNERAQQLLELRRHLLANGEIDALVAGLDGGYIAPVAGGDLIRNPSVVPTGRNLHGFDPSRLPSQVASIEGRRQAERLLERCETDGVALPERIAMVLWGTDTLKNEGVGVAEALWLMGAQAAFDGYGRLIGAELIPLETLGRSRIDVVVSVSGIFRDLLPRQLHLLADAALKCARADEPLSANPIRKHALCASEQLGIPLNEAALRVFGNADSAYGANVNQLIDSGLWDAETELGDMFVARRSFAYGLDGRPKQRTELLQTVLGEVDLTFQNLDSVELGITTLDHYVDSLGGISRAVENARGSAVPTLVGDYTQGQGAVRSLAEQINLETRTRMLNPRWYEGLLEHGYEGVHQLETHVSNTMGWSATTRQVAPWVYRELSKTFVLDEAMRERLADLNPKASLKLANRLLEAHERNYWSPDDETLEALQKAGDDLEDRVENVIEGAYA